jgi:drug/metabolite transporter (DMT)-like permease
MRPGLSKTSGVIKGVLAAMFWGFNGAVTQYIFSHYAITSYQIACIRMISAGLVLLLFLFLREGRQAAGILRDRAGRKYLLMFSVFGLVFNQTCYFNAIRYSDAGTATVMQSMSTLVILLFTCVVEKRIPPKLQMGAVCLALFGVYLVSTESGRGLALTPLGLVWGLLLAIAAAAYILLSRPIVRRWSSMAAVGYGMLIGGIIFSAAIRPWHDFPAVDARFLILFAYHVLFGTVAAFSLFLSCINDIGPVSGNLIGNIEPLTASVVAAALLHTAFTVRDITGFLCIMSAVIIVQLTV